MNFYSGDIFSGCGGLTEGMNKAGFKTLFAVEIDTAAVETYKLNHKRTLIIQKDVRKVTIAEIKRLLGKRKLHLLAGCPPCQGFSSVRTLNGANVMDDRNSLILEYLRFVKGLKPLTIMIENVPALKNYYLFKEMVVRLQEMGYSLSIDTVNVKDYGVPQRRKRLVLLGSLLDEISIAANDYKPRSVRDAIGKIEPVSRTKDFMHTLYPKHSDRIQRMIRSVPKNGGGRRQIHWKYRLKCHQNENVGFNDIYGRLRWDDYSTTITGGCLNPSKGRFLHPTKNRTITAREAALLQSFPKKYKFYRKASKDDIALMIGNALPPRFSAIHARNIHKHLKNNLG